MLGTHAQNCLIEEHDQNSFEITDLSHKHHKGVVRTDYFKRTFKIRI